MDTTLTPEHIDLYTGKGLWPNRLITDYLDEVPPRPRTRG
jgi:hypothetical protein